MTNFQFSIFNFQFSKKLLLFSLFSFLFAFVPQAKAANFTTNYNVTYAVSETGKARVTQEITLTNNTAYLYPADYTLTVKGGQIEKVAARDELGEMKVEVSKTKSDSTINVSFNKHAIGQGSKVSWTLSYEVPEFTVKHGRIWELTVPRVAETSDIGDYNVTLKIPKEFGSEHYISPQPDSIEHNETSWVYRFNQQPDNQTRPGDGQPLAETRQPVSAAFGDFQLFTFRLLYHLQNPESFAATTEVALPPNLLPYQKIYYQSLEPKPQRIYQDADGNYLAEYKLSAKEKLDIVFEGMAQVSSKFPSTPLGAGAVQSSKLNGTSNQSTSELVNQLTSLQPYLLPAKYWEVNAEEIQSLVKEIIETNNNYELQSLARAIYTYVTTNLSYDPTRMDEEIKRLGALKALEHKDSAVCMEFTDLLITLMRAAGIPARELDGYAYTSEDENKPATSDTLHSWVQIYLSNYGWLNIDPTWGATTGIDYFTKLDTSHLAFVIKGIDSEKPYPAGSYKIEEEEEGDVQVSFAEKFADNVIPLRLWWENWERENKKLDWLTAFFHFFVRWRTP